MPFLGAYYFNSPRGGSPAEAGLDYCPFFGQDVDALRPGQKATIGEDVLGYPFSSLRDLPAGEYYVQAVLHVYTKVTPAHGHTIWLPLDDWEGQQFHLSPGNLISEPEKIRLEAGSPFNLELELTKKIPPHHPQALRPSHDRRLDRRLDNRRPADHPSRFLRRRLELLSGLGRLSEFLLRQSL